MKLFFKKDIAINITSQIFFGGGSISIIIACSHYSNSLDFGRISSIFTIINLLVGAALIWVSAKWRDEISLSQENLISHIDIFLIGMLPAIIFGGLLICFYDAFFFKGNLFSLLLISSCLSSTTFAVVRRNYLLTGQLLSALKLDIIRSGIISIFIIYWIINGANFKSFCWCLITIGIIPLIIIKSKIFTIKINNFIKNPIYGALVKNQLRNTFFLSKKSNSLFFSGITSIISSQLITILVPAIVDANSVATVRVYEILFFPLFFGIQSIDSFVSRKMVFFEKENIRKSQINLAIYASFVLFFGFLLFIFLVYISDFSSYSLGLIIPNKYNESPYILYYIITIGAIISISVGWRWLGFGWHDSLNLQVATFYAAITSIIIVISLKYFGYSLHGIFISRILYEFTLLLFISRAGLKKYHSQ
jgi:hypothetical protein